MWLCRYGYNRSLTDTPPSWANASLDLTAILQVHMSVCRRGQRRKGRGEDSGYPPSSSFDGSCGSLKHSSSVDDIKSRQSYWEKRLQLRNSCTGEHSTKFSPLLSAAYCVHNTRGKNNRLGKPSLPTKITSSEEILLKLLLKRREIYKRSTCE